MFYAASRDTHALCLLRANLNGMEQAFQNPGELSSWSPDMLHKIDQVFVKNYLDEDGEPVASLFFPNSADNLNRFMTYCNEVDHELRMEPESAPRYAREYFLYFSIWQMRGWSFPVPLGTASVVGVLAKMAKRVKNGFSEVSACFLPHNRASIRISADDPDPGHIMDRDFGVLGYHLKREGFHI
jgi:hypothetical protein